MMGLVVKSRPGGTQSRIGNAERPEILSADVEGKERVGAVKCRGFGDERDGGVRFDGTQERRGVLAEARTRA